MKVTNLVALLPAVLLTVAEFLVFEYDHGSMSRSIRPRPPVCFAARG